MIADLSRRQLLGAAALFPIGHAAAKVGPPHGTRGQFFSGTAMQSKVGLEATAGMDIQACMFADFSSCCILVDKPLDGLTIEESRVDRSYRFLDNKVAEGGTDASLTNFIVRRVNARNLARGMWRIRYNSAHGLIEDVAAYGSDNCVDYCVGFALDDQAHDVTYRRSQAHGFIEAHRAANKYWNGDGFSDERGNSQIRYEDCLATDCSDGGFDVKSTGVVLQHCIAMRNKRNYRLWSSGTLTGCQSHEPKWRGGSGGKSHFSFHGNVEKYVFERPVVRAPADNTAPVFFFATNVPATIEVIDADIDAPGAPLISVQGPQPNVIFSPPRDRQRIRTAS